MSTIIFPRWSIKLLRSSLANRHMLNHRGESWNRAGTPNSKEAFRPGLVGVTIRSMGRIGQWSDKAQTYLNPRLPEGLIPCFSEDRSCLDTHQLGLVTCLRLSSGIRRGAMGAGREDHEPSPASRWHRTACAPEPCREPAPSAHSSFHRLRLASWGSRRSRGRPWYAA